ncbi:hypothetical protein [Arachidicoccus sp.]|uniref:hypothetical protein n=1 Tax=Arachidicoccus sp. TaxID=1872624 RepID=UPI003D2474A5
MENLKLQEEVINLGKLFVKELKLEPGVDTFSRWMAHYLAEKITAIEQSEGREKEVAEKECFDVILKLWEHRHSLPSGRRPLQSFEPILDTLSQLNPDTEKPYFYNDLINKDLSELETDNLDYKSVEEWMNIAKEIDKTARIWIAFVLNQAALKAKNEKTQSIIENAVNLHDNDDIRIIQVIFDNDPSIDLDNYKDDSIQRKYRLEKLNRQIEELAKFTKLNEFLLESYKKDLAIIQQDL